MIAFLSFFARGDPARRGDDQRGRHHGRHPRPGVRADVERDEDFSSAAGGAHHVRPRGSPRRASSARAGWRASLVRVAADEAEILTIAVRRRQPQPRLWPHARWRRRSAGLYRDRIAAVLPLPPPPPLPLTGGGSQTPISRQPCVAKGMRMTEQRRVIARVLAARPRPSRRRGAVPALRRGRRPHLHLHRLPHGEAVRGRRHHRAPRFPRGARATRPFPTPTTTISSTCAPAR